MTQRGQRHSLSFDGIGLAWLTATAPRTSHQPGRHPKDALTRCE
jgi:hypothetical protein